jgi:hypothetical protein
MDDGEVSGYEPYSKYLFKVFMGTAFKSACYLLRNIVDGMWH